MISDKQLAANRDNALLGPQDPRPEKAALQQYERAPPTTNSPNPSDKRPRPKGAMVTFDEKVRLIPEMYWAKGSTCGRQLAQLFRHRPGGPKDQRHGR